MLAFLTVRNFALVSDLEIRFTHGLSVITGESGAGKSMLLGALGLVLGQRVSKSQIRPGSSECEVLAEFDLKTAPKAQEVLQSYSLTDSSDPLRCVVRRLANVDGRSRAWVNSTAVNLGVLRELCTTMVAIHTQFAQQQLLSAVPQLNWFNDFINQPALVDEVFESYNAWQAAERSHMTLNAQVQANQEKRDLLQYQVEELDQFDLKAHEYEELSSNFKRLNQAQTLLTTVSQVIADLEERATSTIGQSKTDLDKLDDSANELSESRSLLSSIEIELNETLSQLRQYVDTLNAEEENVELISSRLDAMHDLARKHRVPTPDLYDKNIALHQELDSMVAGDEDLAEKARAVETCRRMFLKAARKLSKKRQIASKPFAKAVVDTLAELGIKQAQFELAFSESDSENGLETVEYLVSANPSYGPALLKDVASGGEISRISLAILTVVASKSKLPCLVLDEADVGVGGTSANELGRMLKRLACHTQVVCVTHAPQIAALGDAHLRVLKNHDQAIKVCELHERSRVEEIARMVGGQKINKESLKYASVLLEEAQASSGAASP